MGKTLVAFQCDAELYAAFKAYCRETGPTVTWALTHFMRETLGKAGKLPLGVVLAEGGKRSRSQKGKLTKKQKRR